MEGIAGKRALVTGGNSGIGLGIALKLCELGAEVFIVGRNKETLDSAVKESQNKITAIQLDIGDWNKTRETIEQILPIQLLVNNAAVAKLNSVLEATNEDFDFLFNVNVKAMMNITQVVTRDLIARKMDGRVVNVSSQSGQRAAIDHLVYSMTKASVDMLTKMFALELGSKNIRVNAVSPTVVMTEMGRYGWSDQKKADRLLQRIPAGRFAEVEEIVNPVIYLLSDKSDMINGHSLPIDGGYLAN